RSPCSRVLSQNSQYTHDTHPVFRLPVSKLAVQGRYNMGVFSSVLTGSLQGIAERPLPCNYNVIQFVCALSLRQHGFNLSGDTSKTQKLCRVAGLAPTLQSRSNLKRSIVVIALTIGDDDYRRQF